ncbi:MAG: ABC-type polysaccharide/polyol phosphate transport system ATPase subunit [Desulforhopalus sp.]|jgi:ABC-type polysaccharide/polyol phosphate transport system ATPase subunit
MIRKTISVQDVSKDYCLYRRSLHRVFSIFFPFVKKIQHQIFHAVRNVDVDVHKGESIGIIGRNGSGKSTMLQLICGIIQPTSGKVEVDGRISALLELGAGFNPEFSGRENVYLSTSIMGLSKDETTDRLDDIIEFADIGEFIDHPVKTYSSGMFVRLAFATAISVDPDILIVDEALAVGDIFFQQKCMAYMKKMMDTKTIVLVSHDMHAVSNLCDRIIVMEEGKKLFDGDTLEGISLYTRLVHNERFKREQSSGNSEALVLPQDVQKKLQKIEPDDRKWITVGEESRGGAGVVNIHKVSITKNGDIFQAIECGERVRVRMFLSSTKKLDQIIFGYTVKDRVGVAIFGENTVAMLQEIPELPDGYSVVTIEFDWPEVISQDYTLTLGVGEGDHPFHHTIQCWAHNIFSVSAITPGRCIHGLFNNELKAVALTPL